MRELETDIGWAIPERLPFRMHDFTRLAWVSDRARDVWGPRLQRIGGMLLELELVTVERGWRQGSLRLLDARNFDQVEADMRSRQLTVVRLRGTKHNQNYFASLIPCENGEPDAYWCAVGHESNMLHFVAMFAANADEEIGRLLGYPSCCTEFYQKTWLKHGLVDTTWPMAAASNFKRIRGTNEIEISQVSRGGTHLRWLGARAVFHLPCSFDCEPSAQLAARHLALADELGFATEASWLAEVLEWPVEWSALHGIAEIRTPVVKIVTRTDATPVKYVVRYLGNRRKLPSESVPGTVFPFAGPSLPVISGSHGFALGLDNPIDAPAQVPDYQTQPWFCEDNGFRTRYAMDRAHVPIVVRVERLLREQRVPQEQMRVIDFGCGNGVLLGKIARLSSNIQTIGIDVDHQKIEHARIICGDGPAEFRTQNMFYCDHSELGQDLYIAIVMVGRLLEAAPDVVNRFLRLLKGVTHLVLYAYDDYIREFGSLRDMAERVGIVLTDDDCETVSLATIGDDSPTVPKMEVLV